MRLRVNGSPIFWSASHKIDLMINLKIAKNIAKALGLNVPASVLGRADEVIE